MPWPLKAIRTIGHFRIQAKWEPFHKMIFFKYEFPTIQNMQNKVAYGIELRVAID